MASISTRAIPATYVRLHLGSVLSAVQTGKRDFLILRNGQPVAALIAVSTFSQQIKQISELKTLASDIGIIGINPDEAPTAFK